jgi:hypothetical protein
MKYIGKMAETESLLSICCTTVNYKFKPLDDILAGEEEPIFISAFNAENCMKIR